MVRADDTRRGGTVGIESVDEVVRPVLVEGVAGGDTRDIRVGLVTRLLPALSQLTWEG